MDRNNNLSAALNTAHLGALASLPADPAFCPANAQSLILIGPQAGARWWRTMTAAPEWRDGLPDPVDRWSKRIIGALARDFDGAALFPSDGPPFAPFLRWAQESQTLWQSPVGLLVHARLGLWVSFRGALALPFKVTLAASNNPCQTCTHQPCRTACPVNALSDTSYDVTACHAHLDSKDGKDCLTHGCHARRACPAAQSHARLPEQSAYHMSRFHQ